MIWRDFKGKLWENVYLPLKHDVAQSPAGAPLIVDDRSVFAMESRTMTVITTYTLQMKPHLAKAHARSDNGYVRSCPDKECTGKSRIRVLIGEDVLKEQEKDASRVSCCSIPA